MEISLMRFSILCLYLRMTPVRAHHITIWVLFAISAMHGIGAVIVSCETPALHRMDRRLTFIGRYFSMPSGPPLLGPCYFPNLGQTELRQPDLHECCEFIVQPGV